MSVPQSSRQPAKTEAEVRSRYITLLSRAMGCVSQTAYPRIGPAPRANPDTFRALAWTEEPIEVRTPGGGKLYLAFDQLLELVEHDEFQGELKYTTRMYSYAVYESDDPDAPTLFHWHWNPTSDWEYPHLHLGVEDPRGRGPRLHIPTGGRVTIEDVIEFLIREELVMPVDGEAWKELLSDGRERFRRYRSRSD